MVDEVVDADTPVAAVERKARPRDYLMYVIGGMFGYVFIKNGIEGIQYHQMPDNAKAAQATQQAEDQCYPAVFHTIYQGGRDLSQFTKDAFNAQVKACVVEAQPHILEKNDMQVNTNIIGFGLLTAVAVAFASAAAYQAIKKRQAAKSEPAPSPDVQP